MSKILNVDLDDKTHEGLSIIAERANRSMRYVARETIKARVRRSMRDAAEDAPTKIRNHRASK